MRLHLWGAHGIMSPASPDAYSEKKTEQTDSIMAG